MRYKTVTVRVGQRSTGGSCSALSGEIWDSVEEALNELAIDGWEIDHVINKTDVNLQNQEQVLLNQPILILKNERLSKEHDIEQQIKRQKAKIDSLSLRIDNMDEDDGGSKYKLEEALKNQIKILENIEAGS
jgi:hypothetical protein